MSAFPPPIDLDLQARVLCDAAALQALRDSEERLSRALTAGRMFTFDWDAAGGRVQRSANADALFGIPGLAQMDAAQYVGHVHPDDLGLLEPALALARERGGALVCTYRLVRPDGSCAWAEDSAQASFDDTGKLLRLTGVCADVSERMRSEELARARSREFAMIAENVPASIIHCDEQFRFRFVNRRYAQRFGSSPEALIGKTAAELIGERAFELIRSRLEPVLAGQPMEFDYEFDYQTIGRRMMHGACVPDCDEKGVVRGLYALITDVTEQRRAERALQQADRRKDEFLAMLAHELRNPLAPLRNALEVMRRSDDDPARLRQARQMMERQVRQMVRLIDDLLDLSRVTTGKIRLRWGWVSLAEALHDALEAVGPLIRAREHRLDVVEPDRPLYVRGDATRLTQTLVNLLSNAARYTPPGGQIRIALAHAGDQAIIAVRDNGAGIDPELFDSIFEMFAQGPGAASGNREGLGIGLHLAKRLIEKHGGTIEARSEGRGKGSEFIVRLPRVDAPPLPREADAGGADGAGVAASAAATPARVLNVLVVDDNGDAVDSLVQLLRLMGHRAIEAGDGTAGLALAREQRPDLVLLDLDMPELGGLEVARRIRAEPWGRTMRLVALTGHGRDADRTRTREAGFDDHLVKPVDPGELEQLLSQMPATPGPAVERLESP